MNCAECRFNWDYFVPLDDYPIYKRYKYCFIQDKKPPDCTLPDVGHSIHGKIHKKAIEKRKPKNIMKIVG